jgi:hypothetical protein
VSTHDFQPDAGDTARCARCGLYKRALPTERHPEYAWQPATLWWLDAYEPPCAQAPRQPALDGAVRS